MRRILFLCLLLLTALMSWAVPAKRVVRQLTLADGTSLQAQLVGDEYSHYWLAADGTMLNQVGDGSFHRIPQKPVLSPRWETDQERRATRAAQRRELTRAATLGQKKGLIILVNYKDKQMVRTRAEFAAQMNDPNYSLNGHIGSLADYFFDQSYGQLHIDFDVVGPYTVSRNMDHYGKNDANGDDQYPGDLITEAVELAHADGVNFSHYDWDGDKKVDQVFVIYAGYSEAEGAPATTIWPHEWTLSAAQQFGNGGNGPIQVDGVTVNTYACSSELSGSSGRTMAGIGSAAHEFSHCLGLPDFYDTKGNAPGMGMWSLMDYGCYNVNGSVPAPYTSYERWYSGWLTPTELSSGADIKDMFPLTAKPEAYVIYNEANRNEYYLLENHQQSHQGTSPHRPWDKGAYAHGMLVLHVDYSASAWMNNTVNTSATRQRMTIVPANNRHLYNFTQTSVAGNTYPGTTGNASLTNTTTPAATLYNANADGKKFLSKPIENIIEADGLVSFRFNGGAPCPAPTISEQPEVIDSTSFVAKWDAVSVADTYTLELTDKTPNPQSVIYQETFSTNEHFAVATDGTTDISSKLFLYLDTYGCEGNFLYLSPGQLKMGTTTSQGKLIFPLYSPPSDGEVRVEVRATRYAADMGVLNVSLQDAEGNDFLRESVVPDGEEHTLTFQNVSKDFRLVLNTSSRRAYLQHVRAVAKDATPLTPPHPRIIDRIPTTNYTLSDLLPGHTYAFRVRACAVQGNSPWSQEVSVTLPGNITAIDNVFPAHQVSPLIFNLAGQRVDRPIRGLYIVGGKKVLFK